MKTQGELPLSIAKKFFISFMVVMLVFLSVGVGSLGMMSYATSPNYMYCIEIPTIQTSQTLLLDKTILSVKQELASKGFTVISAQINVDKLVKEVSSMNMRIPGSNTESPLQRCVDVKVAATVINLNAKDYYFKSEADASALVEILDKNNISYSKEQVEINPNQITQQQDINNQIDKVKQEAEQKAAQEKALAVAKTTTSRGSTGSRTQNYENRTTDAVLVSADPVDGEGTFPLENYYCISSPYGPRWGKMHTGTDLAAAKGTNVFAWKSGVITYAGWNGNYGNFIEVAHYDGTVSRYAHLSGYAISKGDVVNQGQTIGYVGTTGNSTGYHLHFEIKINDNFVNPMNYL